MINILYIHGFISSPFSYKAQQTKDFLAEKYPDICYHCPQLDVSPQIAIKQLTDLIDAASEQQWYIIGSSLGGYYANYLVEQYGLKAVLVNPAVKPYELLAAYIGEQKSYHNEQTVIVKPCFMDELKNIEKSVFLKKNYLVMLQTGDEVLNYQEAANKYRNCSVVIEQGGDHSFVNFQAFFPDIMQFFTLCKNN